ncbi:MAG: Na+ dependent nucleoside transporter N-terminal domain-containing protein, partial [Flavobacteriales bacterium]
MMKILTTLALALLTLCLPGNISATQDTLRTDSVYVDSLQQAATVVTDTVKTAVVPPFRVASEGVSLMSVSRGMLGILICVIILFLFSNNRAKINWKLVISGIVLQLLLGILVLKVPFVKNVFEYLANAFAKLIGFADSGVAFLFGSFASGQTIVEQPLVNFAIKILPTVIFFSALTSVLFYFGILQKVVYVLAWV